MIRAITLDYWDTIYVGAALPDRVARRREALFAMVERLGGVISALEFDTLYRESAKEADRWWREEHRGYRTADRIRWLLNKLAIERPENCEHIAHMVATVDETLLQFPPPLLPGAREALEALGSRFALAIISDTGFASGDAQNAVLERDGVLGHFQATIYSMDVGHAKPRPEIFTAALNALGVAPGEALHVGDNERTDVGGALGLGMRAVRLDAVRQSGETRAEYVARSLPDLADYLLTQ
ncbi:MAG: HAD family hydrolase [Gemmatimonadaceae bacterium]